MKSPTYTYLLMIAISLGLAVVVFAESPQKESWELPEERSSIDLEGADLVTTLTSLGKVAGVTMSIHPSVEGNVTHSLENETLATIFHDLCSKYDLQCSLLPGTPMIFRVDPALGFAGFGENISMSLAGAPLGEVLVAFGAIADGVEVSGEYEGTVTIESVETPWPVLLEHLCAVHDCRVDWQSEPIRVTPSP